MKLVQIGSNWIRLIIWLNQIKLVQIGSNQIKWHQVGSNWFKLDQKRSVLKKIKMNQIDYLDKTGSNEIR